MFQSAFVSFGVWSRLSTNTGICESLSNFTAPKHAREKPHNLLRWHEHSRKKMNNNLTVSRRHLNSIILSRFPEERWLLASRNPLFQSMYPFCIVASAIARRQPPPLSREPAHMSGPQRCSPTRPLGCATASTAPKSKWRSCYLDATTVESPMHLCLCSVMCQVLLDT